MKDELQGPRYRIGDARGRRWIQCGRCGTRSFHPDDVRERYCGVCSVFHDQAEALELLEHELGERPAAFTHNPRTGLIVILAVSVPFWALVWWAVRALRS